MFHKHYASILGTFVDHNHTVLFATNLLYFIRIFIFGLSQHYKEFVNQKRIKILIFSVDIKFKNTMIQRAKCHAIQPRPCSKQ